MGKTQKAKSKNHGSRRCGEAEKKRKGKQEEKQNMVKDAKQANNGQTASREKKRKGCLRCRLSKESMDTTLSGLPGTASK
jgi:hypothetical protein